MATALLKLTDVQLGTSVTATNNFTIYQPASPDGTVRIGNGNSGSATDIMTLTSAGNVGVGSSSPVSASNYKTLTINGTTGGQIVWQSNGSTIGYSFNDGTNMTHGSNNALILRTNGADRLTIDSAGNLGLGVTPSAWASGFKAFEIGRAGSGLFSVFTDSLQLTNNYYYNGTNYIYAASGYAERYHMVNGTHNWYTAPSGTAGNAITFTQAMTLDASGNLSLDGGGSFTLNNAKALAFKDSGGTSRWCAYMSGGVSPSSGNDLFVGNPLAANTVLFTNNTERMRIDSSGNVGIGTSSPDSRLFVRCTTTGSSANGIGMDAGAQQHFWYLSDNTTSTFQINSGAGVFRWVPTGSTEAMRIDSSGNLLVGTTSLLYGSEKVSIYNSSSANQYQACLGLKSAYATGANMVNGVTFMRSDSTVVGYIGWTGSTTTYATSSDYRLKENIQPMQNALGVVAQLNPVTYTWKADGSDGQGFIAHELQAVVPDCVTGEKDAEDEDGNPVYQGIDTSFLVATLTAAIQEQQAIIESLTKRIETLEGA